MKKAEQIICDFIYDFINENWDKIDLDAVEIDDSKSKFLSKIKNDVQLSLWILTDVSDWGMDKKYLSDVFVTDFGEYPFWVIKINEHYIKIEVENSYSDWNVSFAKIKTKTIQYFE